MARRLLFAAALVVASGCSHERAVGRQPEAKPAGSSAALVAEDLLRFDPPAGWKAVPSRDPDGNLNVVITSTSACAAYLDAWPMGPSSPGEPMVVVSKRAVVVDGVSLELLRTQAIGALESDAFYVRDGASSGRFTLQGCTPAEVATALGSVRLSSRLKK